jgi:histone H3/H4
MEITNYNTSIQKGLNRAPFGKISKSGGNGHSGDVFRNLMEE